MGDANDPDVSNADVLRVLERLTGRFETTERLHAIEKELQLVRYDVRATMTSMQTGREHTDRVLNEHNDTLYGNGRPGVVTIVDRLDQDFKGRVWRERAVWVALLGLAGAIAVQFLH